METAIKFLVIMVLGFLNAAWVMVLLGWAHGQDARVPAFGYWTTLFLVWAITAATTEVKLDDEQ